MGYYSNLHIIRQNDKENYDRSGWGNVNEYLLEDLYKELELCNENRPKDWNDQYFDAGLAKVRTLKAKIEKLKAMKPTESDESIVVAFVPIMRTFFQNHDSLWQFLFVT